MKTLINQECKKLTNPILQPEESFKTISLNSVLPIIISNQLSTKKILNGMKYEKTHLEKSWILEKKFCFGSILNCGRNFR